jgi:putative transposase
MIALFRYQLIRGPADGQVGAKARGAMVRELAAQEHPWPFGGTNRFSRESNDRWIKAWKQDGFDGQKPAARAQGPITEPRVLLLAGTKVELVYDPFDLAAPITVHSHQGVPAGTATLLEIRRHVHPKAKNALADRDAGAQNVSTGIDYLRLLEDQHRQDLTGAPISFEKLTRPAAPGPTATQENTP